MPLYTKIQAKRHNVCYTPLSSGYQFHEHAPKPPKQNVSSSSQFPRKLPASQIRTVSSQQSWPDAWDRWRFPACCQTAPSALGYPRGRGRAGRSWAPRTRSCCSSAEAELVRAETAAAAGGWWGNTVAGCCSTAGTGRMKERSERPGLLPPELASESASSPGWGFLVERLLAGCTGWARSWSRRSRPWTSVPRCRMPLQPLVRLLQGAGFMLLVQMSHDKTKSLIKITIAFA